jgi:hypothetical protein
VVAKVHKDTGQLSPKQTLALRVLTTGGTVVAAAEAAGVVEGTVYRWLGETLFRDAYRSVGYAAVENAAKDLHKALPKSIAYLSGTLDDADASAGTKLKAASLILEHSWRAWECIQVQTEIEALKRRVEELSREPGGNEGFPGEDAEGTTGADEAAPADALAQGQPGGGVPQGGGDAGPVAGAGGGGRLGPGGGAVLPGGGQELRGGGAGAGADADEAETPGPLF